MSQTHFPVPESWTQNPAARPWIDSAGYEKLYLESITDPDRFWAKQAERLHWFSKWSQVKKASFEGDVAIRWFEGASLNVTYNCVDRHLAIRADQNAIIWVSDN